MSKEGLVNSLCAIWLHIRSLNFGACICFDSLQRAITILSPLRQSGQTSAAEVKKRDLRAELLAAEQEARNKKRKAEGKPPLPVEGGPADDEANKRRKLLQDAIDLDKDDDDEEEEKGDGTEGAGKGKAKEEQGDR